MRTAGFYVGLSLCTVAPVAMFATTGSIRLVPEPGQRGRLPQVGEVRAIWSIAEEVGSVTGRAPRKAP